ncbi:hypothetical protein ILUMI_01303 [Ignelater luminosus]|uniref:Palmitoleoyl-protein carboxylesterase NOTUM n=1 Tax=Ignelater luminosus TaxID=2038154 RepID=A0A8K0DQZ7_IGNLU|nr:hypothetical protein ILUMI_01303 [Ignelater luminosus]
MIEQDVKSDYTHVKTAGSLATLEEVFNTNGLLLYPEGITVIVLWMGLINVFSASGINEALLETPIHTNTIQRFYHNSESRGNDETRSLKKVFLSNRSVTCNDGSQAGFYLRKSHISKKWIIFLEGGWYCYDQHSCRNRWLRQRHYMTSSQWPDTRDVGGILSPYQEENPYWWNANHVFVPYCTSDSWSGTRRLKDEMFNFMGTLVVQQVVRDLVPLGLENSTNLLLTGSSAGGTGVMINLDPVRELLHEILKLKHIAVRGVTDSGWFLDRTPYAPTGRPAVEAIRKGMQLWQGRVPKRCRRVYENEPWRCYFGYRLYPTLKTPLFIFQWLFDEAQMDADNVGAPVTKQQWDYIHKMGDALRQSFENVSAVFAPSCISHSVLTKRDWLSVNIDDISIAQALYCWEQQPIKRSRRRRKKNSSMFADEPSLVERQVKTLIVKTADINKEDIEINCEDTTKQRKKRRKRRRKNRKNRKNRKRKGRRLKEENELCGNGTRHQTLQTLEPTKHPRLERSVLRTQKRSNSEDCPHRRLERCTWPQCNHSCPRLHNPFTGEEMDFIELLKSFGLDMESVADALGIDMATLNNMDHAELLNLLTQQAS